MKKTVAVLTFLCLLIPLVAGGIRYYDSSLYTADFSKDIHIDGWARGDANPDGSVSIVVEINAEIARDAHNSTTFNWFKVQAIGKNGDVLANQSIEFPDLAYGQEKMKTYELRYPVTTAEFSELRFLANHSPLLRGGGRITRKVQTTIAADFIEVNQSLEKFRTNMSEAYRDQRIYVNGSVEDIAAVNVSGVRLQVTGERFEGWIPLRRQYQLLDTGRQNLTYDIITTRGNVFERDLPITVLNRPPSMQIDFDGRVVKGEMIGISVDAEDDIGIQDIVLTLEGGEERRNESGGFTINTSRLSYGRNRFNITVTDVEGETVTQQHGFNVQIKTGGSGEGSGDAEDGQAEEDDEEEGSSIPIIGAFRRWMTDLLSGLFG